MKSRAVWRTTLTSGVCKQRSELSFASHCTYTMFTAVSYHIPLKHNQRWRSVLSLVFQQAAHRHAINTLISHV